MKKYSILLVSSVAISGLMCGASAFGHEKGDWLVRVGVANVAPNESSGTVSTDDTGALPGTSVGVDSNAQLGLNFVYMLSDNWAVELLGATPFQHNVVAKGLDQYGFSTTNLGDVKHLPPVLSAQYYFGNASSQIRPYLGLGINYTVFFSESLSADARDELGASDLSLDSSLGLAANAGIDWSINKQWFVNASVWYMDISTDASFQSALGKVTVSADIDPWAYMLTVGYRL